jgi:hypothetical protein
MSNPHATIPSRLPARPAAKRRKNRLVIGSIVGTLVLALFALAAYDHFSADDEPAPPARDAMQQPQLPQTPVVTPKPDEQPPNPPASADEIELVDDDGQTLWQSPTQGKPFELAYLPPGVQIVVALRPDALANHAESEKLLASLGPVGERAVELFNNALRDPEGVEHAVIGCEARPDGTWLTTFAARLSGGKSAVEHIAAKLPKSVAMEYNGRDFRVHEGRAYYAPDAGDGKVLVVAPENAIQDIIDLDGQAPPLRRDVERLLEHTDADREVTIVIAPNSLFSEGRSIFRGELSELREPLYWFLGDELSAAALSFHWDEDFFLELAATPTLDTSPETAARILKARVEEGADKLEAYIVSRNLNAYGRQVIARFPAMARKLATYTRSGFEPDCAVLRCYLPVVAGHNLLMATELTLADAAAGRAAGANLQWNAAAEAASPAASHAAMSMDERLTQRTSLRFARDTLEAALEQLSQDIGVAIVIRGPDLQADGITKNQSFGINVENKPASEILVEILRLANPDKSATGADDLRQKLVYVIGRGESGEEQIVITTRARVAERQESLPAVFQPPRR